MAEKRNPLKVSLILTSEVQIRSWLSRRSIQAITSQFELSIYVPDSIQRKSLSYESKILKINYYKVPKRKDLERNLLAYLITSHLRWSSFRRRFKYEFLNQGNFISVLFSIKSFLRSIKRNNMLLWMALSKRYRLAIYGNTRKELEKLSFTINSCDMIIVVSNCSDLANEIAIQSANNCKKPLIQVVENWDNLSSKLCPAKNPKKLIVWGQQTKNYAIDIHDVKPEMVVALGGPRLPNRKKINNLKFSHRHSQFENGIMRVFYPGYGGENEDEKYLSILHAEISREFPDFSILIRFRPHPLSIKAKGKNNYSNWPSYIEIDFPKIQHERGLDWPKLDDSVYSSMLQSDLVIGTPSTFLLEAMLFNLPIILDLRRSNPRFHSHRNRFVTATHFTEILSDKRIPRFNHDSEIGKITRSALVGIEDYSSLTDFLVYNDDNEFVERLVTFLNEDCN